MEPFILFQALENSSDAIVLTNKHGIIEYVNEGFVKNTGYNKNEAIGKHTRFLKSGKQTNDFYRNMWETITKDITWKGEMHNRKKSGALYWESVTITPVINNEKIITNYLAIKTDISDHKRLEDMYHWVNAEKELNWGIAILDEDFSKHLFINKSYAFMHGYMEEELLNKPYMGFILNPEKMQNRIQKENYLSWTAEHLTKNGTPLKVNITAHSIKKENSGRNQIMLSVVKII